METLQNALKHTPLFYITRDIERAIGFDLHTPGYFIISNDTAFGKTVQRAHPEKIFLVKEDLLLDTWKLLERFQISDFRFQNSLSTIVVFKNTPQIERVCKKNNWRLLNPSAELANRVEEKISQVEWLGELAAYLPPHRIALCKDISWNDEPFVVQFNRAHTGEGTRLIASAADLIAVQKNFPNRPARVTARVQGPVFTNNNVVAGNCVLVGNISYQITGLLPFTDNPFATIGNDWRLPRMLLSTQQQEAYRAMAEKIGRKLAASDWRGLFGMDVVLDEATGNLSLIEINARQPASASFESMLQQSRTTGYRSRATITTLEAHFAALHGINLDGYSLIEINDGAQVVMRNSELRIQNVEFLEEKKRLLEKNGYRVILYENTNPGSDVLRIQGKTSIMKGHTEWNEEGKKIIGTLFEN